VLLIHAVVHIFIRVYLVMYNNMHIPTSTSIYIYVFLYTYIGDLLKKICDFYYLESRSGSIPSNAIPVSSRNYSWKSFFGFVQLKENFFSWENNLKWISPEKCLEKQPFSVLAWWKEKYLEYDIYIHMYIYIYTYTIY